MVKATNNGFTLLEVLMSLAIISVISVTGYIHYQDHITRTQRLDGEIALSEVTDRLEAYYSRYNSYEGASLGKLDQSSLSPERHYQITIAEATKEHFRIEANPIGRQARKDRLCGTLSIDDAGTKTVTGVGTVAECW